MFVCVYLFIDTDAAQSLVRTRRSGPSNLGCNMPVSPIVLTIYRSYTPAGVNTLVE